MNLLDKLQKYCILKKVRDSSKKEVNDEKVKEESKDEKKETDKE